MLHISGYCKFFLSRAEQETLTKTSNKYFVSIIKFQKVFLVLKFIIILVVVDNVDK